MPLKDKYYYKEIMASRIRIWPFSQVARICSLESPLPPSSPLARPYNFTLFHFMNAVLITIPLSLLTLAFQAVDPIHVLIADCRERLYFAVLLRLAWRDVFVTLVFTGAWQHLLYSSRFTSFLLPVKFNKKTPDPGNLIRQVTFSLSTTLMGTLFEFLMLLLYAEGRVTNYFLDLTAHPWLLALWAFLMPVYRDAHFYCIHRMMHPWRTTNIPDLGKFLYRHVHSLHHKSYNPSAWSGISMHPVEGFLFESVALTPCFFFHHPLLIFLIKIHLTVVAQLGHDGYDDPGHCSYFHYLHHAHFECNYGTENMPFDVLFGTFEDGSKFQRTN